MRAFRPSRFAPAEEFEEDNQRIKAANIERYAKKAEKDTPLFERVPNIAQITAAAEVLTRS